MKDILNKKFVPNKPIPKIPTQI